MSLKYAILAALSDKPGSGYELSSRIDSSIGFFWSATHQQIYRELKALSDAAKIQGTAVPQSDRPDKKIYELTESGLEDLKNWIRGEAEATPSKDPLLIRIFAGHLVPREVIIEILDAATSQHFEQLKEYQKIRESYFTAPESLPEKYHFQYITLRRGILAEEAWLAWARETREFLVSGSLPC